MASAARLGPPQSRGGSAFHQQVQQLPPTEPAAASSFAYLAAIVRDHGGVARSAELYQLASIRCQRLEPKTRRQACISAPVGQSAQPPATPAALPTPPPTSRDHLPVGAVRLEPEASAHVRGCMRVLETQAPQSRRDLRLALLHPPAASPRKPASPLLLSAHVARASGPPPSHPLPATSITPTAPKAHRPLLTSPRRSSTTRARSTCSAATAPLCRRTASPYSRA